MRESCTYGSVRGALSNERTYRNRATMQRRDFIMLLGGAAAAWPLAARAQQRPVPVIGFLNSGFADHTASFLQTFLQALKEAGYIEGQNVSIEYRWAEDQNDRLPALAADLVRRQVSVIVAPDLVSALAARTETNTIPILFVLGSDPIRAGFVASLNRPGGNATGVVNLNQELLPKRLELLHELVPGTKPIAVLRNPATPTAETSLNIVNAAARILGRQLAIVNASNEN
jgi:ABC-type uncharacterized transport system substrate-binding protein